MNTNMNLTMNMYIYIEDEHKHKREREYEHDEDGDKHEELREDDVGFFSGSAAEAAGLGMCNFGYGLVCCSPLGRPRFLALAGLG